MTIATTHDGILNRSVALEQPAQGYRVAVDTVLLAACVDARAGQRVLDMGCGVGGVFLALARRVAGLSGVGVEAQQALVDICRRNILRNDFAAGFKVEQGDVTHLAPEWRDSFDHVVMNPPYHEEARHDVSPNSIKHIANTETDAALGLWIAQAAGVLVDGGAVHIIHRADRRAEILEHLTATGFGDCAVIPVLPKKDAGAKRVILRAFKGTKKGARDCAPLILHQDGGGYTPETETLLREARALPFA